MSDSYHDRPEWSYSQMKVILDDGIDYAVAAKNKTLPPPDSEAIDLGELAHALVLNRSVKDQFALSEFKDFRTNAAKEWRDKNKADGKTIVPKTIYDIIADIVDNIEAHPYSKQWLTPKEAIHEQEMYATLNGIKLRGKADSILEKDGKLTIVDIKTTAQFSSWNYKAMRSHYDLQAALYLQLASAIAGNKPEDNDFYFCVVETKKPFRVKYQHAGPYFIEHGLDKLDKCLREIENFGDKQPNFLDEEIGELGDFSL